MNLWVIIYSTKKKHLSNCRGIFSSVWVKFCVYVTDNVEDDLHLFVSARDTESSDNDSCCDPEDIIVEEEMLEDTNIEGERNTHADGATQDSHGHWMVKLLEFMLLAWQAVFKVSDYVFLALLQCIRQFMGSWDMVCELINSVSWLEESPRLYIPLGYDSPRVYLVIHLGHTDKSCLFWCYSISYH